MAYSEIINEIQEQIDDIQAHIASNQDKLLEYQAMIDACAAKITEFQQQLVGLQQLKTNAQTLIDSQGAHDINLNINVSGANGGSSTSSTTYLTNNGPFQ